MKILQESLEGERMQYVLPDGSMLEVKHHIGDLLIINNRHNILSASS